MRRKCPSQTSASSSLRKSKQKPGEVYFAKSTRKNGKKMEYVGSTTRSVKTRESEHKKEVAKPNSKTWVGKGTSFKVTNSISSSNPRKAESTIKKKKAKNALKVRSKRRNKK
jgi:hypothetical protein